MKTICRGGEFPAPRQVRCRFQLPRLCIDPEGGIFGGEEP